MKYRIEGINKRNKFKHQQESLSDFIKIMKGESVKKPEPKPKRKYVRTKLKNDMAEKELEKKIILCLQRSGYWVFKTGMGGSYCYNTQYNKDGMADLQVYGLPNKITMLEVKSEKGKQRKSQKEFEDFCNKIGIKYAVVRSVKEAINVVENI